MQPPSLPVRPLPPLAYAIPLRAGRPGIVTAIGVISIVIASLSALFSLQTASTAMVFAIMSRIRVPSTATTTTTVTTTSGGVSSVSTTTVGVAGPSATSAPTTAAPGATPGVTPVGVPHAASGPCILLGATSLANLGFAALLMVAGIQTLRHSPGALRLHRFYAWVKIPLAFVGSTAYGWVMAQVLTSTGGPSQPMVARYMFVGYAIFLGVLGSAYPIGLLIALRTRAVRAYYHSIVALAG